MRDKEVLDIFLPESEQGPQLYYRDPWVAPGGVISHPPLGYSQALRNDLSGEKALLREDGLGVQVVNLSS